MITIITITIIIIIIMLKEEQAQTQTQTLMDEVTLWCRCDLIGGLTDMQFRAARSLWMMFLLLRYSIPREMSSMNCSRVCRDKS